MLNIPLSLKNFANTNVFVLACLFTFVFIWVIAIFVLIKARSVRINLKSIVPEYDPPKDISPVFARFIMVSGKEGGMMGEVSKTGNQLLTLIDLYEDGLLKKLSLSDESTLEYEINENFKNINCVEEERKFLERLNEKIGMSGKLHETFRKKSPDGNGYAELGSLWYDFWYKDLYGLAISRGYMQKESRWMNVLSLLTTSITFGVFFSVFLSFIPVVGIFLAGILLLPVIIVFLFCYFLANIILPFLNQISLNFSAMNFILTNIKIIAISSIVYLFFSYFAWLIIFGTNMSKLFRKLTPSGLELVRKINGYKIYLKGVDRDRLSFSFNRESDLSRNRTSFSWLGVFGMITKKHWDEWYEITGSKQNNDMQISVNTEI